MADSIRASEHCNSQADLREPLKADTPLIKDNYIYIFLQQQFEQFWQRYPEKKSKGLAQKTFEALAPNESLFQHLMQRLEQQITHVAYQKSQGIWVASWKHPANWLTQRCWEDELSIKPLMELNHVPSQKNNRPFHQTTDWFSPPKDDVEEYPGNIVYFKQPS